MTIGIYLIGIHQTALRDIISLCYTANNKIIVYTSGKMINLLKELNPDVSDQVHFEQYKGHDLFSYNRFVAKQTRDLDFLILSPNSGRKGMISHLFLKPRCPYIFIDVLFGDAYLNELGFFRYDRLSNALYRSLYRKMMRKASGIIYSSREILEMITPIVKKPGFFFPFNLFSGGNAMPENKSEKEKLQFTVTGTIERKRKDLQVLFDAADILIKRNASLSQSVKIVLLGGLLNDANVYGRQVVEKALKFNADAGMDIFEVFPVNFIEEKLYREKISNTDIILNILNMDQYKYGKFCSGMAECIAYQLPGIYPASYGVLEELESSSLRYSGPDVLASVIEKLVADKLQLDSVRENARANSKQFSLELYSEKFMSFFDQCRD